MIQKSNEFYQYSSDPDLRADIKNIEQAYATYKKDEDDTIKYIHLKRLYMICL